MPAENIMDDDGSSNYSDTSSSSQEDDVARPEGGMPNSLAPRPPLDILRQRRQTGRWVVNGMLTAPVCLGVIVFTMGDQVA